MNLTDRPANDTVRNALRAVLSSEAFARSERLRSFLAYVVENELAGKAAQLKGYSIGIDVFGRSTGFDAGNDPLVRVQAGKLRKLLDLYYATEGATDDLRIRIPIGSYVPEYRLPKPPAAVAPQPAQPSAARKPHQPGSRRCNWLPAPVSSPLAMLSLLPLLVLAPAAHPDSISTGIANSELILAVQHKLAGPDSTLPQVQILRCWPAGAQCSAIAEAVAGAARYYPTIRLLREDDTPSAHDLSYSVRIDRQPGDDALFLRLVHDRGGETVYARRIGQSQMQMDSSLTYEAVSFGIRAFSPNGLLYRHAARNGAATPVMECLARAHHSSQEAASARCSGPVGVTLAEEQNGGPAPAFIR
ncbi:hypothetical protein KYK29_02275 [Shinella daejeonensis]|uniref:hypothetical protein n=1 Tax=Shinella daejeonensis TaxID=659017 RepID=UPI0020C79FF9|nr:hypothetical protein [Shinella daejeonensis]MCP8893740.1 hypothetical protein [Shinella daejeonensis]